MFEGKFIPGHILDANYSPEGYFAFVSQLCREMGCSYKEAWEAAGEALEQHYMPNRYSSYESFIVSQRMWRINNMPDADAKKRQAFHATEAAREGEK